MAKLSKIEAAQRQLDCAIRLYFDNDDLLAVHALSRAAFRVLYVLQPADDDYKKLITQTMRYLGWGDFNELTNFIKHADRDPDAEVDEANEVATQVGIGFAAMLYRDITATLTPEMKAFHLWMKVRNPERFPGVREPDWEFEQEWLDANEFLKTQPRELHLITGKVLLQVLKDKSRTARSENEAAPNSSK
jgi:hypothetical protein